MRKTVIFVTVMLLAMTAVCASAADVQKLVDERTVVLYPEGQQLGNMVVGARGKIQFIYVDGTLAKAVRGDSLSPDWLAWNTRHWGTAPVKGKTLFIIRYEANKPWSFSTADLAIGGRNIEPSDILTLKAFIIEGDLPSGAVGIIAAAIPAECASPGKTAAFAYGGESVEWTAPKK